MNDEEWQATGSGETNGPIISQTDSGDFTLESESDGPYFLPGLPATAYLFSGLSLSDSDGGLSMIDGNFSWVKRIGCTDQDYLQQRTDL